VTLDPEVLDPEDPEILQDLLVAALNEAGRKVDDHLSEKLGGLAPGIPGLG
jgi:DNA-binding protein YbaB